MKPKLLLTAFIALLLSLLIAVPVKRIRYSSDATPNNEKAFNNKFWQFEAIPIEGAVGPESFAFDPLGGGPYTGISDGRIIKWDQNQRRWINFAITSPQRDGCEGPHDHDKMEHICGRPLGLGFDTATGDLYIADAYMGLLVVGPNGGMATKVATRIPLGFTNGLDIDHRNGVVYFSDSSSQYQRRNHISSVLSGDKTGRLMKYDQKDKLVTVLLKNLSFPNGVALSENGHYILVADSTNCKIMRYWLETSKAGTFEVFAQLPGFPDNIKRSPRGGFWVAIYSRRERILEWMLSYPWIGNALLKLPFNITKAYAYLAKWRASGMAVRLSEQGEILETFEEKSGIRWRSISEVKEKDGNLWIGSIIMPFVGMYKSNS
ncbi:protein STRICTOSIDINE SYNTHASE-LIKE 2 [Castanea sativa]|uniref:protein STRICTOSIDINE SYNTHASE-LIKE 2 n=1 Tax=Castanea sativa TaxID=21020 RepID=UPI003F651B10